MIIKKKKLYPNIDCMLRQLLYRWRLEMSFDSDTLSNTQIASRHIFLHPKSWLCLWCHLGWLLYQPESISKIYSQQNNKIRYTFEATFFFPFKRLTLKQSAPIVSTKISLTPAFIHPCLIIPVMTPRAKPPPPTDTITQSGLTPFIWLTASSIILEFPSLLFRI